MYECTCGATYLCRAFLMRHINGTIPRYPSLREVKVHKETEKSLRYAALEEAENVEPLDE